MEAQPGQYKLAEHVLSANVSGDSVLMDYQSGKYFGLTGAVLVTLEALREGSNFVRLRELVMQDFGVDAAVAEADLRDVLQALIGAGLVQFSGRPTPT